MIVAKFQKVSRGQFLADLKELLGSDEDCYDQIVLPKRATAGSAGYDFCCPVDIELQPGESVRIPTGIRCRIDDSYVLQIHPRSSLGFKYQMTLLNTTGIIDSDYYNADNEGHIIVAIRNGSDRQLKISRNDRFVQGVFLRYYLAEEDEGLGVRTGGFGSTDQLRS